MKTSKKIPLYDMFSMKNIARAKISSNINMQLLANFEKALICLTIIVVARTKNKIKLFIKTDIGFEGIEFSFVKS
ncbi:hypothetical protein FC57_GL001019 [Lactobacillus ultunensis DSM 16047]|nr:hypothetical protein FC57_GL001019 [Lactobacillus ultunensis DSM 16047]